MRSKEKSNTMELHDALKEKLIESFAHMDMRMLDTLLPDNGLYENAYKEVWLRKLGEFYEECKQNGDSFLTVRSGQCPEGPDCDCKLNVWVFESPNFKKGFAISFMTDNDGITGIERCYSNQYLQQDITNFRVLPVYKTFTIYDNEKIGFIDSVEFRSLKKKVDKFIRDFKNPNRHSVGPLWIKRKVVQYNSLFFELMELPYEFEHQLEFLLIYKELYSINNIFSQQKSYHAVLNKYHAMRDSKDIKSRIRAMKWLLLNIPKVHQYLLDYSELTVIEGRLMLVFKVGKFTQRFKIIHLKVDMDFAEFQSFQRNSSLLFNFFSEKYHDETNNYPDTDEAGFLYNPFKDRLEEMITKFEEWSKSVVA